MATETVALVEGEEPGGLVFHVDGLSSGPQRRSAGAHSSAFCARAGGGLLPLRPLANVTPHGGGWRHALGTIFNTSAVVSAPPSVTVYPATALPPAPPRA